MAMFELKVTGVLSKLIAGVRHAESELDPLVAEALLKTGEQIVSGLKDAAPVGTGRSGGHLDESFSAKDEGLTVHILTSQAEKYHWVTQGTKTPIRPLHAKMLHSPELP